VLQEKLTVGCRRQACPSYIPQQLADVTLLLATSRAATVEAARAIGEREQGHWLESEEAAKLAISYNISCLPGGCRTTASSHECGLEHQFFHLPYLLVPFPEILVIAGRGCSRKMYLVERVFSILPISRNEYCDDASSCISSVKSVLGMHI